MNMDERKTFTHPSYGLMEISRCYCSGKQTLFGSPLAHSQTIRIRLYGSEVERSLNHDWYHTRGLKYEVELSPNQWAELVSSFGMSPGTPCTIRFDADGPVETCPYIPTREVFDGEFKDSIKKTTHSLTEAIDECKELFNKKSVTKSDKQALLEKLNTIQRQLNDTIPFIQKSFNEKMDESVVQAKNELQAWAQTMAQNIRQLDPGHEEDLELTPPMPMDIDEE